MERRSRSTWIEQSRPGTEAVFEWRGTCDRVGTGSLDVRPPCPAPDRPPSSRFSRPQLAPQKAAAPALGHAPFKSLDRVRFPMPTVLLPRSFPAAPSAGQPSLSAARDEGRAPEAGRGQKGPAGAGEPPCRGRPGLPRPTRPAAAPGAARGAGAHSPRTSPAAASSHTASSWRPIPGEPALRATDTPTAAAASPAADTRQPPAADPGRWEPPAPRAPPAARPLPAPAPELALRRRRPGRSGGMLTARLPDLPLAWWISLPSLILERLRAGGEGAEPLSGCCGSRSSAARLGEGAPAL